jgi:peptide/nickel transport system substrate-binding protein
MATGAGRRSVRIVVAIAAAAAVVITGVFAGVAFAQTSEPPGKTVFIFGDTSEPSSLNPLKGYLGTDYTIWALEFNLPSELAAEDFGPDLEGSITTSVDVDSSSMAFTYHLRPDMKWSDGEPFTANDVAWTLNYYVKYKVSNYAADTRLIDNVEVVDDTTFVIHSTQPTSVYSGSTVFMYDYILPEHIWGKYEDDIKGAKSETVVPAVGSGPFVVQSYAQGDNVTMVRNPNYWGEAVGLTPHVDEIIYKIFNDENQEAAALQQGEIDFGYFDSANILDSLQGKANIATHGADIPLFDEIGFNSGSAFQDDPAGGFTPHGTGSHAAADPAFRRVVREAISNQELVDKVYGGYAVPADSPVQPDATTGNWDPPADDALPFDLDQAKTDLTAAGYTDTDGDEIVNDPVTGDNVVMQYFTRTSDQNTIKTAPFVKNWLEQIGIGVNVQSVSNGKLTAIIEAGNYDMFHWGWFPNPDPNYILAIFTCEQRAPEPGVYGNNDSFFCDPEYDRLYDEQLAVTDPAERTAVVQQMQQILWDQMPYLMLAYTNLLEAYRTDRFTGFIGQPGEKGDLLATWGPFSFINLRAVGGAGTTDKGSSGIPVGVWIAVVGAIVVVALWLVLSRRRRRDEDRA